VGRDRQKEIDNQNNLHVSASDKKKLPVKPISVERDRPQRRKIDPRLPQPPFRLGLIAPTGGGKTVLAVNLLMRAHFYREYFERVFVWSPTIQENPEWKEIVDQITETYEDVLDVGNQISDIIEHQKIDQEPILCIFDDEDENISKNTDVIYLMKRGRHFNISSILMSQQYNTLSAKIRTQFSNLCIWRVPGGLELETITKRQRGFLTRREFEQALFKATEDPHSFLHINHQTNDQSLRYMKNFDVKIFKGHLLKQEFDKDVDISDGTKSPSTSS